MDCHLAQCAYVARHLVVDKSGAGLENMVGVVPPKDGINKIGYKSSVKNLGKSKSPPPITSNADFLSHSSLVVVLHLITYLQAVSGASSYYNVKTFSSLLTVENGQTLDVLSDKRYILTSDHLPNNTDFYPTLANGYIGTKLFGSAIFMTGLYNGRKGQSHRARIPSTLPYVISHTHWDSKSSQYVQNMVDGIFSVNRRLPGIAVEQSFYAHQLLSGLLVTEVKVMALQTGTWSIDLKNCSSAYSPDLTFHNMSKISFKPYCYCDKDETKKKEHLLNKKTECKYLSSAMYMAGVTNIPEEDFSRPIPVHILSSAFPPQLKLTVEKIPFSKNFMFFTSVGKSFEEASYFYKKGLLLCSHVRDTHATEWKKIWGRGKIQVTGSPLNDQIIVSSLYYLLSSFPSSSSSQEFPPKFYGVSPGGLSNGGIDQQYFGHVFWDQDFWMMPALLPFYPELVKAVLHYRIRNLPAAQDKAKSVGYNGAMFPWECAYTGYDVCPGEDYIRREIHITGDIVHLLQQYVYITNDWSILTEGVSSAGHNCVKRRRKVVIDDAAKLSCTQSDLHNDQKKCFTAWDLLRDAALFWQSRVRFSFTRNHYVIDEVMGPDEWHSPVNNSVFTNYLASKNLRFAANVAVRLGVCLELAHAWLKIASDILIGYDARRNYHPEYDGFVPEKDIVKQADTILLGFPMMLNMPLETHRNDLVIYENATTENGPAMTWGMFCINWLAVKNTERASEMYLRQLANAQKPFLIWSENADSTGCTNFLTGIGSYLQSVIFGYFGLRLYANHLSLEPVLLPVSLNDTVSNMAMRELKYRGLILEVEVSSNSLSVKLLGYLPDSLLRCAVIVVPEFSSYSYLCQPGQFQTVKRTSTEIFGA